MGPADLQRIVARLPKPDQPDLLVGIETGDDAAVYRLTGELAVVQTLDFFMPVVDDPFDYGRIAAANSISDVYAMGGRPVMALAIVGIPLKKLPAEVMGLIMEGAAVACKDAGIFIVGGHSIDDEELKFGLAVTGVVHPDRILRNSTANEGDLLVLTKPIGSGTLASAVKKGVIAAATYAELLRVTTFLNRVPSEAALAVGVSAATDVTGFSLLGHAHEMAVGAGLSAELWMEAIPELLDARACIAAGIVPGATARNLAHYGPNVAWADSLDLVDRQLLADPQTSGGLLLAVAEARLPALLGELRSRGALAAAVVGRMTSRGGAALRVLSSRP